jgi:hypothetical protein
MWKKILFWEEMLSEERQSFHLGGNVIMQGICYCYRNIMGEEMLSGCYPVGANVIHD